MNNFDTSAVHSKKEWAAYCHDYLLNTLGEADEPDWTAARALKDIYDCHTCVYHIAQVYVKGIIPAMDGEREFGGDKIVQPEEAALYIRRLTNAAERLKVFPVSLPKIKTITKEEAKKLTNANFFDVSSDQLFTLLRQNPLSAANDLFQPIILTCKHGYKSTLIADILIKTGFQNVYLLTNPEEHNQH